VLLVYSLHATRYASLAGWVLTLSVVKQKIARRMCSASADACPNENFFVFSLSETAVSLNSRYMAGVLMEYPARLHSISLKLEKHTKGNKENAEVTSRPHNIYGWQLLGMLAIDGSSSNVGNCLGYPSRLRVKQPTRS